MYFKSSATATAADPAAEAQPRNLEFYRLRDDMVRTYLPATEEERLLVTQIARTWLRLQRLYDAESSLLEQQDLVELFTSDQDRFKLLHRAVAEAERMWRNAVEMFRQARRRRESQSLESPRRLSPVAGTSAAPPAKRTQLSPPVTERTQSPDPREPLDTKRTQFATPETCSHTSTSLLQIVEKNNTPPVGKSKGSLN